MKEATIYYSKTPHPSHGSKYWEGRYSAMHHGKGKIITLKENFFRTYWRKMPIKEMVNENKLDSSLETIFAKYNDYSTNPYSSENNGQRIIKEKGVHHTSMSVEDVVKVGKTYYVVAGLGFKKLKLI